MQQKNSLTRGFFLRYVIGVVGSILAVGLFWLYNSHQALRSETEILKQQATQRQMVQLKERTHHVLEMIQYERQRLDKNMRAVIQQRTLEAYAVMETIYQSSKIDYSTKQIEEMIRNSLRAISYNQGRGYYFATGMDGIEQLFPPNPALEGTSFLDVQDLNGQFVVRDMIQLIKEKGEGYYQYTWTKPGSERQQQKIAYLKYFAPLDWFVGTGEYIDDLVSDLQSTLIQRIENTRFKDGGYVFIATYEGLSLTYPAKGRNMYEVQDNNGLKIVQELIRLAKSGGGYLNYLMPPKLNERPELKVSYVTGLDDWQWYLGSGDFVADLDQELAVMLAQQKAAIKSKLTTIVAVLALFLLFGIFLSRQLGRQISASFQVFQQFFARAASNAEPLKVAEQSFAEFSSLAESANRMLKERQHFEHQANDYRNQLRNIIDAMPSILATITPAGEVSQWNKFAAAKTGIAQTEAIGKQITTLLPYLQPFLAEILATTCDEKRLYQNSVEIVREDETRDKNISAYPLGFPQPHSIVVRVDDVTERKMLEKTLVQSEKMLSVGGLAAGMAHEVNNPLSAIMQNLHLIQNRLSVESSKSRQLAEDCQLDVASLQSFLTAGGVPEKIEHAITSCTRAATIVKNMLNFSRDGQSDFKATDLALLVDSTLELLGNDYDFQRKYNFREIRVERDFTEGMPAVVCEASKIQQVLFNLLKNGTQAMAAGEIPLAQRCFKLAIGQQDDMAVVRVTDSGPGMPEKISRRIFEPFYTTKAVGSGTGLGLFVAYFIIHENHSGSISVESVPGQGTTFTIKLPLQPPAQR